MDRRELQAVQKICKRKLRWAESVLVSFLITGTLAFAAPIQTTSITADTQVAGTNQQGTANGAFFGVSNSATATIQGDMSYTVQEQGDNEAHLDVTNGNLVSNDKLSVHIVPDAGNQFTRPKGIIVRGKSDSKIENLDVDVVLASEQDTDRGSADSNAAYGVAVGYGYGGGAASDTSRLTVGDANIHVTNTENTVMGSKTRTRNMLFFNVTAKVNFGHQLSGIKVFRNGGANPEFISNGTVNINVEDKSTAKIGDYLVGVYASGKDTKVTFNGDTNIRVAANGINSAGIKIGKPVEGEGGATVTSNGKLVVDTTETADSAAVRLFSNDSKFIVTGDNTDEASEIKSANSAIVFDTQDYKTNFSTNLGINGDTSRNAKNENSIVELTDTILTTTSSDASLIKAKADTVIDITLGQASALSGGQLNSGNFNVENAKFTLKGEKSLATAAQDGWLIEVEGTRNISSDLTVTLDEKAKMVGMVHKEANSKLDVTVDHDATWELKTKGANENTSVLNELHLQNGGTLDAAKNPADYVVKLSSNGVDTDGMLVNGGVITLANANTTDVLTVEGNYVGQNGIIKMNTEWNGPGDEQGGNSQSDVVHIKGKAIGSTTVIPVKADGTENIIDGSIGDIQADLHKRTVAVIKVDDDTAYNSRSFVGTAHTTGAGEIQLAERRNDDGTREHYWTLTALNPENPVPPVVVPNNPNNPVTPPVVPNNPSNPVTPPSQPSVPQVGTPIYSQVVSGYTQMPRANMNLAYDTLRTLHERKGENQILTWEHYKKHKEAAEGQVWVRILGNRTLDYGKHRFNMEAKNKGFQIGKEFSIKRDEEGKHVLKGGYLSFQESRLSFEDRYRAQHGLVVEDKFTGTGRTRALSLGLTRTSYTQDGEYLDLVGQLSYLDNRYHSRDDISASNHAWGVALSAEYGKPYEFAKDSQENTGWIFEPQAQLIYQYMNFSSFQDPYRSVDQKSQHGLRGRLGFRLAYNDYDVKERKATTTWYTVANLWHDFTNDSEVRIGRDHIYERYARTLGEVGLGLQVPIEEQSYLYADVRHARAFGRAKHREYRLTIGLKYTF